MAGVTPRSRQRVSCSNREGSACRKIQITPVRKVASKTIDAGAIIKGILLPGSISDRITAAYRQALFGDATLQDLPDRPRFVINATSVQSGALVRFSKPYSWDCRVGKITNPRRLLAESVTASSGFPPVLSPVTIDVSMETFEPNAGDDLQFPPYTKTIVATDGGAVLVDPPVRLDGESVSAAGLGGLIVSVAVCVLPGTLAETVRVVALAAAFV
jgi:hypothetical protein